MRILLVDDDPDGRELLGMFLSRHGYEVDSAGSLREATSKLKGGSYRALVTDLHLPEGDGRSLLEPKRPEQLSAAIVLSGSDGSHEQARSAAVGFDAHLVKPVAPQVLCDLLERILNE